MCALCTQPVAGFHFHSSCCCSLYSSHVTRQQRWPCQGNEVQVQQLYLPLNGELPPAPLSTPCSQQQQQKVLWISTPTRARHWLATFLGQGCLCCAVAKPKSRSCTNHHRLGKLKDLNAAGCWMLLAACSV